MSNTIHKELHLPHPPERVWRAISTSAALAKWMHPNDFEARVGHRFTFEIAPKPEVNFDGLTVHCEVLECDPPHRLVFSWDAGKPVTDTRVSFELTPEDEGTRLVLEHSGFDLSHPFGRQAFGGADYGWSAMLEQLTASISNHAPHP